MSRAAQLCKPDLEISSKTTSFRLRRFATLFYEETDRAHTHSHKEQSVRPSSPIPEILFGLQDYVTQKPGHGVGTTNKGLAPRGSLQSMKLCIVTVQKYTKI